MTNSVCLFHFYLTLSLSFSSESPFTCIVTDENTANHFFYLLFVNKKYHFICLHFFALLFLYSTRSGYYAEHINVDSTANVTSNSTKGESKSIYKGIHLHNLSYAGPIVMGCGGKKEFHIFFLFFSLDFIHTSFFIRLYFIFSFVRL